MGRRAGRVAVVVMLLALVVLVAHPRAARAAQGDVIQDRGEITVDLSPADACFIRPVLLRRAEPCEGFTPEAVHLSDKIEGNDMIALGLVHLPSGAPGQVLVMRQDSDLTHVDQTSADSYIEGFAKGAAKSVSSTATARSSNTTVVHSGGNGFVRAAIDLDDKKPGVLVPAFAHQEILLVHTKGSTYIIASMGPVSETAALKKLVEDAMTGTTVTHPIPVSEGRNLGYVIGQAMAYVIVFVVLVVAAIYSHRRTKRQEAEWRAYQEAQRYQQYPPQYPPQYPGGPWQPPPQ